MPELQQRLTKALNGAEYVLDPGAPELYTFAIATKPSYGEKFGVIAHAYFAAAVRALEVATDEGKDADAVAAFRALTTKNAIVLAPADDVEYCASRFVDGAYTLVYNPNQVWVNTSAVGDDLVFEMDKGQ
jgi:hypothetical protein